MGTLNAFLVSGSKPLRVVSTDYWYVPINTGGTLLTVTPTASQYVLITWLALDASSGTDSNISAKMGGRELLPEAKLTGFNIKYNNYGEGQYGGSLLGGKGEAFVLAKTSGLISQNAIVCYQILEEDA